ncbi:MAG: hypothetical protein HY791_33000 [Deltaproteobacteria bacterium]|nr:hypothetical protein [Deltaproteobacteria bacterium]
MRGILLLVMLALCACGGSAEEGQCRLSSDCPVGLLCVGGECREEPGDPISLDAGMPGEDAQSSDADVMPDIGLRDSSADAHAADATRPDATQPDATQADATQPDATQPDATQPDAASRDVGFSDATVVPDGSSRDAAPDATQPDAGLADAEPPDAGTLPTSVRGVYNFTREFPAGVPATSELVTATFTPDGRGLIAAERYDKAYVVDLVSLTSTLTIQLPKDDRENLRVGELGHVGGQLVVLATAVFSASSVEGRIYVGGMRGEGLTELRNTRMAGVEVMALAQEGETTWVLGSRSVPNAYQVLLMRLDIVAGLLSTVAAEVVSAGCQDLAIADNGLGGKARVFACGINGGVFGAHDDILGFRHGQGPGNNSHVAARPQGDYALAVNWSSGRLYRYENGVFTVSASPSLPSWRGWNLAFSDQGTRALVVGGFQGSSGAVYEYRHGGYSTAEITDVSIPGFDQAPYFAQNGASLHDVVWRPGTDCGYIVGGCNTITGCRIGYLIRFVLQGGRACP